MNADKDRIELAVVIGCDNHPADYGECVDCGSAAERVLDSDWLAAHDRRVKAEALREARDRFAREVDRSAFAVRWLDEAADDTEAPR